MFFKKIKTDIEDDYDDDFEDDWDDFDLEGGGFEDHTAKAGPREAVTQVAGSFFKGIRDSLLSSTTQKKLLRETLPEGYVSAYDDIKDVANTSKALYDTAKREIKETHDTYLNELAPLAQKYDEKKQSKLSGKLAKYANRARRSVPSNQISEEEMAYTAAANEIFGTALQKTSTEAMTNMAASFEQSSSISRHLAEQQSELMVNQTNALNKSNAFNEQVALKFKQKSLELQFKHYFTARKHLEINTQQLDYLKSTIPDLVKNTGLPDAVKIKLTEQAHDMFKSRIIGKAQDFAGKHLNDVFRGVAEKSGELIKAKLNEARANAGMVSSAADMFGGDDDGFGISPKDMLRDFIFGQLGDYVVNKGIDKAKGSLRDRAENSSIDFEHELSRFGYGKANLVSTIKQMLEKGGTGNLHIDRLLEQVDLSGIIGDRDNVLQKSLSGHLEEQALFDLETKKSITTTIPGLLSEIHGELSTVRSGMGMPDPDDNKKLRMDWETGFLNTRGNIKTKVENKLFSHKRKEETMKEAYEYLTAMGYDVDKVKQDGALKDEQGNVMLTEKDIVELAKAMKTQSYDTNQYIDEVEYARGHTLIDDEESRKNIAKFFTEVRKVDPSMELLKESTEPLRALHDRLQNNSTEQNNEAVLLRKFIENMAKQGFEQEQYLKTLLHGNGDILLETGAVGLAGNGSILMDAKGDTQRVFESTPTTTTPDEVYRGNINNRFGAQSRILAGDSRAQDKMQDKERDRENKVKRAQLIQRLKDEGVIPRGFRELINNVGGDFSSLADKISDADKDTLFPVTAKSGTQKFFLQLTQREHLRDSVTEEEIDACRANWIAQNRANQIRSSSYSRADASVIQGNTAPLRSGINPTLLNRGNNPPPAPPVPPVLDPVPPTPPTVNPVPPAAANDTTEANTFNWNQFISDKLKDFFSKVLTGFNAQDYANMANAVATGVRDFLKILADKGSPSTDRERFSQERMGQMDNEEYGGEWFDAVAEIMGYGLDRFSSNLGNMFGGFNENHFFGGKVGSGFGGSFKHFKRGGKVKRNSRQKRYFKEVQQAKKTIDNVIDSRHFTPANQSLSPLMQAYNREKQLGGDPQVIVASTGEQVLSTANGDAQAFEEAQKSGLWNKFKEFINDKSQDKEEDGEITKAVKNLSREVQVETPKAVGIAKKAISESKQNAIVKLDENGGSAALLIRDIRSALGNDEVKNLSAEDIKLTNQMKEMVTEVSDIIGNKLGGGKEAVDEFWKNFETKCNTEGTNQYKALEKLKQIKTTAQNGKLGPVFKYIESKDLKTKLDRGLSKLKSAVNLDALKNEEGKFDKSKVKDWGGDRALAAKNSAIGLASNVKDKVNNFDSDEFKANAEHRLYKMQLHGEQVLDKARDLKDKGLDKASEVGGKIKNKARDVWYDEDGNPLVDFSKLKDLKLPNLQVGINNQTTALATISRQMSELIRTNALIAIGTGSDPKDAQASDPDSIKPFSTDTKATKLKDKGKGFFGKLKDRFKKEEELDEDGKPVEPKTRYAKFKAWFKRKNSANKEIDPNEPKLVKRTGNRLVSVKATMGQWFRNRKNAGKDAGNNKKQFKDIYIKGQKDPVITGLEISKGMYTKSNGEVINSIDEIEGAILDLSGKVVISQEEFDKGLVYVKNAKGISSGLFSNKNKGGSSRLGKLFGFFKKDKASAEDQEGSADEGSRKGGLFSGRSSLFISATDIYIYGEEEPVLTRKGFKNQEYFDSKGTPITKTSEITGAVFDKDGNQLVSAEDYKRKRLVLRNGKPIQTKKRGLIGSTLGMAGSVIGGIYKGSWWATKKLFKGSWWLAKKPFQGAAWAGKKAFGVNMAEDVYKIGEEEPVLLAKDMKKGNYLDKETGKPITCFKDIKGAVVDSEGNTVITKDDVENKRLLTMGGITKKSFATTVAGGIFGMAGWSMKTAWRVTTKPFRMLFDNKGKGIKKEKSEFIMFDIYVKDDDKPRILAKDVPKNEYFNEDGEVVNKYSQLDKPVYNKDKNIVISEDDIKKGLVKYDGTPIGKIGKGLFKGLFKTASFGFGLSAGILKGLFSLSAGTMKLMGGAFKFTTKVGKGLFNALGGGRFDVDGRDKYALMIQAQAATVDKLEAIRIILDKRLEVKDKKFNDKDGDGVRDGSYLDTLRQRAKTKEEKEKEKKEKAKKGDDKDKAKEAGKGLLDALDSPLTKILIGGLMYTFGPQLFKAVTLSVRSALPSWLGGLSDERRAEIEKNGGIFATAFKEAKGHKRGEATGKADDPTTETDESVHQEDSSGTSTLTKIAAAYLGYRGIKAGVKWGAKKLGTAALARLGIGAATAATAGAATGTAAAGGTLLGTAGVAGATGAAATGTALTGGLATAALGQGAAVTTAATAGSTIAGSTGVMGVLGAGASAVGAALVSPIGLGILAALAVAGGIYAGYKIYKALTKEDNHLAEWRMAQYGYKLDDKDHVTKILNLEDYLSKCTNKATNSQYAKINGQAQMDEALKIFGVSTSDQEGIKKFSLWFHYRFKPFYLAWKTVMMRKVGSDDLTKVDEKLLKADKIALVNDVSLGQAGDEIYKRLTSPFSGEKEVKLSDVAVRKRKEEILTALSNLDGEKHDDKILKKGGGKNKNVSSVEEDKRIQATKATGTASRASTPAAATATNANDKTIRAPENSQSWWNKFLHGDNATDNGKGLGIVDKVSNAIGDFFDNDAKAAGSTVDFAKTFTKGVTINGLTEAQTAAMAANTAETESRFRMGIRNKYGYSGLYQFGGEALAEVGYMKKTGGGWRQQNEAMKNPSNWLNGLSLQKFLSSRELQDKAYVALVNKNLQYGRGMGGDKFQQLMKDYRQVAKYAKMAHLKGAGNAVKGLLYGRDAADGNGTSMIAYGNKAAANVDAILKAMGDGKPVSNAKSDNPAFRLGQQAGEGVRNAVSKAYNKVTGNTPAPAPTPATKLPNKPGVAPAAIAKPTQQPAPKTTGLMGLTGLGGISSKFTNDDFGEDSNSSGLNISSLSNNFTETSAKPSNVNISLYESPVDDTIFHNNLTAANPSLMDMVNSSSRGISGIMNPTVTTTATNGTGPRRNPVPVSTNKNTTQVPYKNTDSGNAGDYPWMKIARSYLGVTNSKNPDTIRMFHREGPARANWGPSVFWCASFAGYCLTKAGVSIAGCTAAAFSFSKYGTEVSGDIPYGAIVVWKFSHVSFCAGTQGNKVLSLGGNQSSKSFRNGREVTISAIPKSQIKAVRFPPGYTPGTYNGTGASTASADTGASDASSTNANGKPQRKYKTNTDLNAAVFTNYEKATGMNRQSSNTSSKNNTNKTTPVKTPTDVKSKFLSSSFNADSGIGGGISSSSFLSNNDPINYLDINEVKRKLTPDAPVEEQVDMPDEATSITSNFTDTKGKQAIVSNIDRAKQTEQIAVQAQIKHQQNLQEIAGDSLDIIKEQLRVQQNMAKDISKLVALMSEANKLAVSNSSNQSTKPTNAPEPSNQQGFMNKHSKTINTVEPVSMKIQ